MKYLIALLLITTNLPTYGQNGDISNGIVLKTTSTLLNNPKVQSATFGLAVGYYYINNDFEWSATVNVSPTFGYLTPLMRIEGKFNMMILPKKYIGFYVSNPQSLFIDGYYEIGIRAYTRPFKDLRIGIAGHLMPNDSMAGIFISFDLIQE